MTATPHTDRSAAPDDVFRAELDRIEAAPACDEDTVEKAARAIAESDDGPSLDWALDYEEWDRKEYRSHARAAVAALKAPDTAGQQVQRVLDLADELDGAGDLSTISEFDRGVAAHQKDAADRIRAAVAGSRPDDSEAGR